MAEVRIQIDSVDGRPPAAEHFDEFEPMKLQVGIPGFVLRWVDRDTRVFPTRKRQGYVPVRPEEFPADKVPGIVAGTEIHFGDSILCKIPLELAEKRYLASIERGKRKRRAGIEQVVQEGEAVTHELRAKGAGNLGKNIVYEVDDSDYAEDYDVKLRDGTRIKWPQQQG